MNSFTKHKIFKLRSVNNEGPVNVVKFKGLNVETPFVALTVTVSHPKLELTLHGYFQYQTETMASV